MTKLSHNLQSGLLKFYVFVQTKIVKPQSAQGALEYIAIAVGLIIVVFAAFTVLGGDISSVASGLCVKILGSNAGC
jgi:hypothetical protein